VKNNRRPKEIREFYRLLRFAFGLASLCGILRRGHGGIRFVKRARLDPSVPLRSVRERKEKMDRNVTEKTRPVICSLDINES